MSVARLAADLREEHGLEVELDRNAAGLLGVLLLDVGEQSVGNVALVLSLDNIVCLGASCLQLVPRHVKLREAVEVGLHADRHTCHAHDLGGQRAALGNHALVAHLVLSAVLDDVLQALGVDVDVVVPAARTRASRHELAGVDVGVVVLLVDQDLVVGRDGDAVGADRVCAEHERQRVDDAEVVVDVARALELDDALLVAVNVREGVERREQVVVLDHADGCNLGVGLQVAVHAADAVVLELTGLDLTELMLEHDLRVLLETLGDLVRILQNLKADVGCAQAAVHAVGRVVVHVLGAVVVVAGFEASVDVSLRQIGILANGI